MIRLTDEFIEALAADATKDGVNAKKSLPLAARLMRYAKDILFFIYLYCGYVQLRDLILSLLGRSRAVVLYYHRIGERDVLTKPADEFRRDLDYLKSNYECINLSELCWRLRENKPFRQRSAVITFDDGYRDNFLEAAPALKSAGMTATFFVATGFIGTGREFPHDSLGNGDAPRRFPKLTWDDLRAMEEAGFEIGSHTINHANMGRADQQTMECEINESLAALDRELGVRSRAFSFPWGKPDDISERAIEEARRAGYYAAVSAYGGANGRSSNLFCVRRIDVGNGHLSRLAMRARIAGFDPDYFRIKLKRRSV